MARNWYPFYVGDYARKTSHLTLEQHGAYRLLLDYYYSTGEPLPLDMKVIFRICRATSRRERDAISTIIEQFFDKTSTGFVSEKCQNEINKALNYSNTQSANAYAKWDAKRMPVRASTTTTTKEVSKKEKEANASKKISLEELSVDHIAQWLKEKRALGKYLQHDEHTILERFKDYCLSKGRKYNDFIAAYRNAFEWDNNQPKQTRSDPASTAHTKAESIIARRNAAAALNRGAEPTDQTTRAGVRLPENIR